MIENASVIIVTYNSQSTLADCIESVGRSGACELIIIDNASTDGTAEWLQALGACDPNVRIVLNTENLGFSAAVNMGLREATGDMFVLLNPDTVVTPGWLDRLRRHFQNPRVGAVGPLSNYVVGRQNLRAYLEPEEFVSKSPEAVAVRLAEKYPFGFVDSKLLIGFCLMIPRRVVEHVGPLDTDLFLGCDDLDLSWRLGVLGYEMRIAADVFVYHVGQASFGSLPKEEVEWLGRSSTDALARKLVRHYGKGKVPSSLDLWGIDCFKPTPGILED